MNPLDDDGPAGFLTLLVFNLYPIRFRERNETREKALSRRRATGRDRVRNA